MTLAHDVIRGATISGAWLSAVIVVDAASYRRLYHLVTCIEDPVREQPEIRLAIDRLQRSLGYAPVETVANTIFPAEMARMSRDHDHLVSRYRRMYSTVRRLHRDNRRGTYFGRIVAHQTTKGNHDQLGELIRKLHTELRTPGPKSARYEMNISEPRETEGSGMPDIMEDPEVNEPIHVYAAGQDNSPMGFPCLSFCSFQLDRGALHMTAHYRRQHLIERGYGNYLGLGRLLGYVCAATHLRPGQLMIVAGVAAADAPKYRIAQLKADSSSGEPGAC